MGLNHTPESKVMALEFSESFRLQFRASWYIMRLNRTSEWKLWPFEFHESFCCSILSALYIMGLNDTPESKVMPFEFVKSFRVQFRASRYIMRLNQTSEWKVMTTWISRKLPLYIFERSIYDGPQSYTRVKSYSHLNFSTVSVVQFPASQYIMRLNRTSKSKVMPFEFSESFRVQFRASRNNMRLNRTSEWKVMTVWISRELLLFNFESLDISWASIIHPSQNLCCLNFSRASILQFPASQYIRRQNRTSESKIMPLEFVESFCVQFRASRCNMRLNLTFEWKVMTIWISREFLLFNFERVDISWASIIHPGQKLWRLNLSRASVVQFLVSRYIMGLNDTPKSIVMPFLFVGSFCVQFRASQYIMRLNRTFKWKVMTIWISRELLFFNFECLNISSASIIHPSQKLCCLNLSRASVVRFRASRYIMGLNDTPESKVMLFEFVKSFHFNFERLDILCTWIGHPSEKFWPFEFHESFCFSISNVLIYHGPQSYNRVETYGHLNFMRASVV